MFLIFLTSLETSAVSQRPQDPLPQTHLSLGEVQLLGDLPPLHGAQVFVLVESGLQFADLLGGELGPHPPLMLGCFALTVFPHLALRARSVTATVWREEESV